VHQVIKRALYAVSCRDSTRVAVELDPARSGYCKGFVQRLCIILVNKLLKLVYIMIEIL